MSGAPATPEERQRELVARLENPHALLSRPDLAALGCPRSVVDRIFRLAPRGVIDLSEPGNKARKPMIFVGDYLTVIESHTFDRDRVRPC